MFAQWPITEADLHAVYGVDCADRTFLRSRSWRWLGARLDGLAARECGITTWALERHKKQTGTSE